MGRARDPRVAYATVKDILCIYGKICRWSCLASRRVRGCRYYADPARLGALLAKMAAQMERGCRAHLLATGRVWDRPRPGLIADLNLAVALNEAFHAQYKCFLHRMPYRSA